MASQDVLDGVAALRVGVDAPIGVRVAAQQHLGGGADSGTEFNDVVATGGLRLFEQPRGEQPPAGPQNAFAELREEPVALHPPGLRT